jgi:putative ABC transport system permease protein
VDEPQEEARVKEMLGWLRVLVARIRGWVSRSRVDEDFSLELAEHLEMLTEENISRGMKLEEARRAARVKLGGITQLRETHRELHGWTATETLFQDVRYALRTLRKSPGFTLVCVLTLGLGMGASTAIFSVVNGVLLRPLPYPNHERLLQIEEIHPGSSGASFTYANFIDLERSAKSIENISAFRPWSFNLTGDGEPEQVAGALVSGDFFSALGSKPLLGKMISAEDDTVGADNRVVVVGYALWKSRFGADRGIVGKTLRVNAEDYQVIGVMPRGFDYPEKSEVWCPLVPGGELHDNRRAHLLTVIADLRTGQAMGNAQGEMPAIAELIEKQNPGVDPGMTAAAVSLKKSMVAPVQPALLILIFAVGLLLLMACANLANLLLARAAARQKEFAIRVAVGAGRTRLARQMLTESVVVALLGAGLGLGIAAWSLQFMTSLSGQDLPRFGEISIDWRVLGFSLLVSLFTGLLFGLAPALSATKTDLNISLKEGAAASTGGTRRGSSQALVVPQFALAVVLLVGAGLLGNSFVRLLRVNPGFQQRGVLTLGLFLSPIDYPEGDVKGALLLQQIMENVRSIPGVRSAGLVSALPITGGPDTDFVIEGRPVPEVRDEPSADIRVVDSIYFQTMGIPLLEGREFAADDNAFGKRVMVINQMMARQYWPRENPIGKRVTMKDWGPPLTGEIVGVVGDVKTNGLDEPVGPMIYWPYFQFPQNFNTIVVRSDGDPLRLASAAKAAIWAVDKNQPISKIETMEQVLSESLARRRLYMVLLAVFAAAALLLASVGIYGVVSYSVTQRRREMGIRIAIGAERGDVLRLVLGQGARAATLGIAFGIAAALVLTRLMASLLFGVSAADPLTFLAVALLLTLVSLAASYIPARRAMRVDPMVALRHE